MYIEKSVSNTDLWTLSQEPKETLRKFIGRFKDVVSRIVIPDDAAIAALRNALWYESKFRDDLSLNYPATLEDALHRATRFIENEEEKVAMAKKYAPPKASSTKEKNKEEHYEPRQHYDKSYVKEEKSRHISACQIHDEPSRQQGSRQASPQPWNKYYRDGEGKRERTVRHCDYHGRCGHATSDCRYLQGTNNQDKGTGSSKQTADTKVPGSGRRTEEIARRFIDDQGGNQSKEDKKRTHSEPAQETAAPFPRRRINMIMGGLVSCKDSVRSIQGHAKRAEAKAKHPEAETPNCEPVTFSQADLVGLDQPHNDPLVIELVIGESEVTRILVDTGSSVDLIFMEVLKAMEIERSSIKPEVRTLTGFDGDSIMSLGTIKLPVYVGGTARRVKFVVIDKPAVYNVILGTPWIHAMQAVVSTYHQCVKFPTPRGTFTIRGNQRVARTCFLIERKLRSARTL